ncbi:MAG: hypothetical protein DCC55_03785 [Chloroflexi bacterium]|nr:MAG: hypothetical protein DCC55_03785 [Chloroflexota bacterium]
MAKRKRQVAEERELTRKEVRLRARDRQRNRRLYIGAGIAIGLALILVIIGATIQYGVRPNSPVATVGEERIITRDFWQRMRFERWQLQNQLAQMQQLQAQFGQNLFAGQITQLQSTLSSPFALGVQVLDQMIDEAVIRQQAAARGITVSDEEVDAALREEIANSRGAITEPQATETADASAAATSTAESWTPTPMATLDASAAVTATATPLPTPEPLPTRPIISETGYTEGLNLLTENLTAAGGLSVDQYREVVRMRLLAEKLQEVVTAETVQATEEQIHARHILIAIEEPVPTPFSLDTITETEPITAAVPLTDLRTLTTDVESSADAAMTDTATLTATAGVTDVDLLTTTDELTTSAEVTTPAGVTDTEGLTGTASISPTEDLTSTAEAEALALAQELRSRLLAGEDFSALAQEYSDDPSNAGNGGDLGWFGRGQMVPEFDEVAFSLPLNEVSEPVKTQFGYHLIEVLEKDANRPKDEFQLQQERQQAFQTWLQEQKTAINIERPQDLVSLLPSDLR